MTSKNTKLLLGCSLTFLLVAVSLKLSGTSAVFWMIVLVAAILLKVVLLFRMVSSEDFKMGLWIVLIMIGVVMILSSLIFKYVYPVVWLRNILFYGAITLKVTGVGMKMKSGIS